MLIKNPKSSNTSNLSLTSKAFFFTKKGERNLDLMQFAFAGKSLLEGLPSQTKQLISLQKQEESYTR